MRSETSGIMGIDDFPGRSGVEVGSGLGAGLSDGESFVSFVTIFFSKLGLGVGDGTTVGVGSEPFDESLDEIGSEPFDESLDGVGLDSLDESLDGVGLDSLDELLDITG